MSSFNFNQLSNMHLIAPSQAANFLPKILAQQQQLSKNQGQHHFLNNQTSGNGPMDLESASEAQTTCDHHNDDNANSSELVFNGMMGIQPQSFMMLPSVMMDPALLGIQQFPILNMPSATVTSPDIAKADANGVAKEIIQSASCTLIPPNPNQPPPTTRERPLGCKTCFIGGLPENITPEIIHEIFERCGEITTLRLSKKNFCHIRFAFEASVDSAIYLSGYRVKIGNNNDPGNTGKIHVDFAQARDDQYEYECRLRQQQREQRHKEKDRSRSSSSPPLVAHYTEHEATAVSEKIKNDETFLKAVQTLITWLERGDCVKKNSNIFYSMIQSTNSHIRRLLNEKCQYEDELREAKDKHRKQMTKMIEQFTQIEKVFNAASHKKVWDHFTRAQRKNIDQWCKQATEVRSVQLDDSFDENDEMDMSDDDGPSSCKKSRLEKRKKKADPVSRPQLEIKIEDDSDERSDTELKNKQIKVLQETIRNLQRKLLETNTKEKKNEAKISELETTIRESNVKELLLRTKIANVRTQSGAAVVSDDASENSSSLQAAATPELCSNEALLISLSTAFLVIHPNGASLEAIAEYVRQFIAATTQSELLEVLTKNEKLFSVDGNTSRWTFVGFKNMP